MRGQVDLPKGTLPDQAAELVVSDGLEVLVGELVKQLLVGAVELGLPLVGLSACRLHLPPLGAPTRRESAG